MPIILINERHDKEALNHFDYLALAGWFIGFTIECAADV
jgi:hypothetical protein